MKNSLLILTGLVATLTAVSTYASTPPAPAVTATVSPAPSLVDKIGLTYISILDGPSLAAPVSSRRSDGTVLMTHNYLGLKYRFTDTITFGPTFHVNLSPVEDHKMVLENPYLILANSKFVHQGDFNMNASIRGYVPISAKSQAYNLITSVRSDQISSYQIGRLTLGTWTFERVYAYGANAPTTTKLKNFEIYIQPNASVQLTPKVAFYCLYEMPYSHTSVGSVGGPLLSSDGVNFEPGVSINILSNLNLTPYVDLDVGNRVTLDTSTLGMLLIWKML